MEIKNLGLMQKENSRRFFEGKARRINEGKAKVLICLHDITAHRELQEKLCKESETDPLTGLLNERGFTSEAQKYLKRAKEKMVFMFYDLNNLRKINSSFNHAGGDTALQRVARILETVYPKPSVVGHLHGDEFAVLASVTAEKAARKKLRQQLRASRDIPLELTAGQASFDPERPITLSELKELADMRLIKAKRMRKKQKKSR